LGVDTPASPFLAALRHRGAAKLINEINQDHPAQLHLLRAN
jgi:hypothetical protein